LRDELARDTVLKRCSIDNKQKYYRSRIRQAAEDKQWHGHTPEPCEILIPKDIWNEAMAMCDVENQLLLELYFGGITMTDIAATIGITRQGVLYRLRNLMTRLKAHFNREYF